MTSPLPRSAIALIPPGAIDLTGDAVKRRRGLQRATLDVLEAGGFEEVSPPTFEYEEIFVRAGGSGVIERLIRFLDLDGRTLALRYDFTASVARVAATAFADRESPLRLCYAGKVYRQEPDRGTRPREILQVGAEILGASGAAADLELIRLALAPGGVGGAARLPAQCRPHRRARSRHWTHCRKGYGQTCDAGSTGRIEAA